MIFPWAALPGPTYDLQGAVDRARADGASRLTLPRGELRIASDRGAALDLSDVQGFEIVGEGTTLVLTRPELGLAAFHRCRGVTLRGFTVRHDPVPQPQGWVRRVDADGRTVEVEMMPGYLGEPGEIPERLTGYVFDPATRNWRVGSMDRYFGKGEYLGARRWRLATDGPVRDTVRVGDFMAFRGKGGTDILFDGCARTRVDGVTIRGATGFAIHEAGGEGGDFFRYSVLRPPMPKGAAVAPLLASNADAFHSSGVRRGPTVEGCRFEFMPDDGVPIHGNYVGVAEGSGRRMVVTTQWGGEWFRPGDRVRVYGKGGAPTRTEAVLPRVVSVRELGKVSVPPTSYEALKGDRPHYEVTLDRDVPGLAADDLACNAETQGDGYVVRGNTILNNRARGMLLTASDGLVEGNTVDGSTMAGIALCPELYWMQSDFARNVVIRGNTVRNTGYAMLGPWSGQLGGILVTAEIESGRPQRGITIEGNRIEGIYGPGIVVRHAADVTLRGNTFKGMRSVVNDAGRDQGFPASGERFLQDVGLKD